VLQKPREWRGPGPLEAVAKERKEKKKPSDSHTKSRIMKLIKIIVVALSST
jgi:hypothetical protein